MLDETSSCGVIFDAIGTCFPHSRAGVTVRMACPGKEQTEVLTESSRFVTRRCLQRGFWELTSNYSQCFETPPSGFMATFAAIFAKSLSCFAAGMWVLFYWRLRKLRCTRNRIHTNLCASLLVKYLFWIVLFFQSQASKVINQTFCKILVTSHKYFQLSFYYWLFVEALHLHRVVASPETLSIVRMKTYFYIGWGIPLFNVILWGVINIRFNSSKCWIQPHNEQEWWKYILHIPTVAVLLFNMYVLIKLTKFVVTKSKLTKKYPTKPVNLIFVILKTALILAPLLGTHYAILFIDLQPDVACGNIWFYLNIFFQSFQGMFIGFVTYFCNRFVIHHIQIYTTN